MTKKYIINSLFVVIIAMAISACTQYGRAINSQVQTNTKDTLDKPYVILISLDGFRWDYVQRFNPPHLSNFIKNGVRAESLIPSFPSKTFPNHYTIATGMYPDKHNLVGNAFYNHKKSAKYSMRNRDAVEDGSFYAGTPIWVQAAMSGMVTASYFFVGTEAEIDGYRPSSYFNFDGKTTRKTRVEQTLGWLNLPDKTRPHLLTLYFQDMDNTGHDFGPNNDKELKNTLFKLDESLGILFKGIKKSKLPINIIIVSDHGMIDVPLDNHIPVETLYDVEQYISVNNGSLVNIHPINIDETETIFQQLKTQEYTSHFKVYKTKDVPGFEYIPQNKNWGSIQVVADLGYYFIEGEKIKKKQKSGNKMFGAHGFDTINKEMHGIFYANGPAFNKGQILPSVKNIHIYPIMCKILGLNIPKNIDGKFEVLENILKEH